MPRDGISRRHTHGDNTGPGHATELSMMLVIESHGNIVIPCVRPFVSLATGDGC